MKQTPPQTRSPLFASTAIAMAVLLAACGSGGSDSDDKTSSSPVSKAQSGSGSEIAAGTGAIAEAITRGQGVSVSTTDTESGTQARAAKAIRPSTTPPISNRGIRGDVLLAMFDQKACSGDFTVDRVESLNGARLTQDSAVRNDTPPVQTVASLDVEAYTYDMSKWNIDGRHPPARAPGHVYECAYPDIRSYSNPVKPGAYTYSATTAGRYATYLTMRYYDSDWITRGVNEAKVDYPLTVTEDQVIVGAHVKLQLEEDLVYNWKYYGGNGTREGRKEQALLSGTARSYQRQALVPFGVLNQWQDAVGNNLRLLLLKADKANEVRLCTHLNSSLARRLHCVTWQVPTGWSWGKELIGGRHYLVEDRSAYAGEAGFMFWD